MAKNTLETKAPKSKKTVETLTHDEASRKNIPTAEYQSVMRTDEQTPIRVAYERRNRDLDPQLVWRGKDEKDWSDLVVPAPPLYIQEKVHPKVLIDDLRRQTEKSDGKKKDAQFDLFADFNGLPSEDAKTEFYQHDAHWSNRMILGRQLAGDGIAGRTRRPARQGAVHLHRPALRHQVQLQFPVVHHSRDVKDGNIDHITREPEQVKAFRDTWRDGIHSYLTYLRDRLTVARDLLTDSGSIFMQIGDENVHRVRAVMEEIFGETNLASVIAFKKTSGTGSNYLENIYDYVLWFAKDISKMKYRQPFADKSGNLIDTQYTGRDELRELAAYKDPRFMPGDMSSQGASDGGTYPFTYQGVDFRLPANTHWKASRPGMPRLSKAARLIGIGQRLRYRRYADDFPVVTFSNSWDDTIVSGYSDPKVYVVQTSTKVIQRCILMATDPGDLVLDPTCGSGTTALRSRAMGAALDHHRHVSCGLALARARVMGARFQYYLLADSPMAKAKEGRGHWPRAIRSCRRSWQVSVTALFTSAFRTSPSSPSPTTAEIDVIWDEYQTCSRTAA
jgi:adenine-specific DNA-methyltransferase